MPDWCGRNLWGAPPSIDAGAMVYNPIVSHDNPMIPIVSLFNHKGGVSKTTTAFNLGWAMAERGKRILIVDGDPQCNLTGTVLGFDGLNDFSDFYAANPNANISDALEPIFKATGS